MRKIREVLRLRHECQRSHRQIAASCDISPATVGEYLKRAQAAGLVWNEVRERSEEQVEARLFRQVGFNEPPLRAAIDYAWLQRELPRVGVTLQLLWSEYEQGAVARCEHPYRYSQFCELYAVWRGKRRLSMRQVHRAGEKLFVDYSGKQPHIVDPATGEARDVELFVAVLGASNYTFCEATLTQQLPDFVASNIRSLEYFGAVPEILVPDQLRSAIRGPDRYDPDINRTFLSFAQHYGLTVIPARPAKPKDKPKVETGVLIAQRWILARLRNRTFFGLAALNAAIAELLEELNTRCFQKLEGNRRSTFESIDRPAMRGLPARRYQYCDWTKARAGIDYHIEFDHRLYSVPHALASVRVEVCASVSTIEVWHKGERVAAHQRSYGRRGTAVTLPAHRPVSHRDYGDWPPERMIAWGASFGPHVEEVVVRTLARYPHPEMGYRPVLGLVRCAQKYGAARTNAACERALRVCGASAPHRKHIEGILQRRLDGLPEEPAGARPRAGLHDNVRGGAYFDKEEHEHRRDDPEVARHEAADAGHCAERDDTNAA
jgi:transposase